MCSTSASLPRSWNETMQTSTRRFRHRTSRLHGNWAAKATLPYSPVRMDGTTPNKEAPAERYLVQVKSNLAPTGSAILFEVAEKGVNFISEMEMTAEEAFLSLAPQIGRPNEKEMKAKSFLIEMLQGGEMLSSDCEEKLEAAGFKKSTIKKAKKNAGVISKKKGFLWYWSLPMSDIPRE